MKLDIEKIIERLKLRKIFISEDDLKLEMGMIIKELYPNTKVRLEYHPEFAPNVHIDILVIKDGLWYPIELKYKTKETHIIYDGEVFDLKEHSAADQSRYKYLYDIQRLQNIRNEKSINFGRGYTLFITNDHLFKDGPYKEDAVDKEFALNVERKGPGVYNWSKKASYGTIKDCVEPIELDREYIFKWNDFSEFKEEKNGKFYYIYNEIEK